MKAITSIYIPRIETVFNAEFIAEVFDRNDIAQVSRVYIEPYKSTNKNDIKYNRAYIGIKTWHATESAFSFIERLRNPSREARIVYSDDRWWPVGINKYPTKLASNKRVLTIFEDKHSDLCSDDEVSTTAVVKDELEEFVYIDAEKTALLRSILAGFKKQANEQDAADFDSYVNEMDEERYMWSAE